MGKVEHFHRGSFSMSSVQKTAKIEYFVDAGMLFALEEVNIAFLGKCQIDLTV